MKRRMAKFVSKSGSLEICPKHTLHIPATNGVIWFTEYNCSFFASRFGANTKSFASSSLPPQMAATVPTKS